MKFARGRGERRYLALTALALLEACTLRSLAYLTDGVGDAGRPTDAARGDAGPRDAGAKDAARDARDAGPGPGDAGGDGDAAPTDANAMSPYAEAVLADHPLAYWRLGEAASATVAFDQTGNAHAGEYLGDAQPGVPGLIVDDPNTAARFNGGTSTVRLGSDQVFSFTGKAPFSLEAWIRPGVGIDDASSYPRIFDRERGNGMFVWGYGFWLNGLTPTFARFSPTADAEVQNTVFAPAQLAIGQIAYVVATYDGSTLTLYLDGQVVGSQSDTLSLPDAATAAAVATIGGDLSSSDSLNYPFSGTIDEVAVYDFALAADRITLHYSRGASQ